MAVSKPTPAGGAGVLALDMQLPVMPGDIVYFANGFYDTLNTAKTALEGAALATTLAASFEKLGELGEKTAKVDSKQATLKSRNYVFAGKRTSTAEIYTVGISSALKDYLESSVFTADRKTFIIASADLDRLVVLNGLFWKADYAAESDGLFQFTLSTEFSGPTAQKIFIFKDGDSI